MNEPPKKKDGAPVDFVPIEENDLAERTFEREGVHVQLDPLTRRALEKAAKHLETEPDDEA